MYVYMIYIYIYSHRERVESCFVPVKEKTNRLYYIDEV